MTKEQANVKDFMTKYQQATPSVPTVPDEKIRALRVKLLLEEVFELAEASGVQVITECGQLIESTEQLSIAVNSVLTPNIVGVADALADIDYVNQGAAVAYGLDLEPFQTEVHRSNMTKLWKYEELHTALLLKYTITPVGDLYLVKNESGKVVKSPSYSPADLQSVFDKQNVG